jgi:hypothetical protein
MDKFSRIVEGIHMAWRQASNSLGIKIQVLARFLCVRCNWCRQFQKDDVQGNGRSFMNGVEIFCAALLSACI